MEELADEPACIDVTCCTLLAYILSAFTWSPHCLPERDYCEKQSQLMSALTRLINGGDQSRHILNLRRSTDAGVNKTLVKAEALT